MNAMNAMNRREWTVRARRAVRLHRLPNAATVNGLQERTQPAGPRRWRKTANFIKMPRLAGGGNPFTTPEPFAPISRDGEHRARFVAPGGHAVYPLEPDTDLLGSTRQSRRSRNRACSRGRVVSRAAAPLRIARRTPEASRVHRR
jgi:hypothetical protein